VGLQRAAGPSRLDGGCELDRPRRHPKGEERDVGRKQAEWGRRAGPRGGGGGGNHLGRSEDRTSIPTWGAQRARADRAQRRRSGPGGSAGPRAGWGNACGPLRGSWVRQAAGRGARDGLGRRGAGVVFPFLFLLLLCVYFFSSLFI
jgi:hypothetical protein